MAYKEALRKRFVEPPEEQELNDEPVGEFSSLGYVPSYDKEKGTDNESFPEINVTVDQLPDIDKKEVGDEITLTVKAEIVSHSINTNQGESANYRLKLTSAKIVKGA